MEAAALCADPDGLDRLPLEAWLSSNTNTPKATHHTNNDNNETTTNNGNNNNTANKDNGKMADLRRVLEQERDAIVARLHTLGLVNVKRQRISNDHHHNDSNGYTHTDYMNHVLYNNGDDSDNDTVLSDD